jgi:hypothetical protein
MIYALNSETMLSYRSNVDFKLEIKLKLPSPIYNSKFCNNVKKTAMTVGSILIPFYQSPQIPQQKLSEA